MATCPFAAVICHLCTINESRRLIFVTIRHEDIINYSHGEYKATSRKKRTFGKKKRGGQEEKARLKMHALLAQKSLHFYFRGKSYPTRKVRWTKISPNAIIHLLFLFYPEDFQLCKFFFWTKTKLQIKDLIVSIVLEGNFFMT